MALPEMRCPHDVSSYHPNLAVSRLSPSPLASSDSSLSLPPPPPPRLLTEFSRFPELPPEIRLMIWRRYFRARSKIRLLHEEEVMMDFYPEYEENHGEENEDDDGVVILCITVKVDPRTNINREARAAAADLGIAPFLLPFSESLAPFSPFLPSSKTHSLKAGRRRRFVGPTRLPKGFWLYEPELDQNRPHWPGMTWRRRMATGQIADASTPGSFWPPWVGRDTAAMSSETRVHGVGEGGGLDGQGEMTEQEEGGRNGREHNRRDGDDQDDDDDSVHDDDDEDDDENVNWEDDLVYLSPRSVGGYSSFAARIERQQPSLLEKTKRLALPIHWMTSGPRQPWWSAFGGCEDLERMLGRMRVLKEVSIVLLVHPPPKLFREWERRQTMEDLGMGDLTPPTPTISFDPRTPRCLTFGVYEGEGEEDSWVGDVGSEREFSTPARKSSEKWVRELQWVQEAMGLRSCGWSSGRWWDAGHSRPERDGLGFFKLEECLAFGAEEYVAGRMSRRGGEKWDIEEWLGNTVLRELEGMLTLVDGTQRKGIVKLQVCIDTDRSQWGSMKYDKV